MLPLFSSKIIILSKHSGDSSKGAIIPVKKKTTLLLFFSELKMNLCVSIVKIKDS